MDLEELLIEARSLAGDLTFAADESGGASVKLTELAAETIDGLVAALQAQRWQPIESAPKDGTRVLIYGPSDFIPGGRGISLASWDYSTWVGDFHEEVYAGEGPTHWMPLPEAPDGRG